MAEVGASSREAGRRARDRLRLRRDLAGVDRRLAELAAHGTTESIVLDRWLDRRLELERKLREVDDSTSAGSPKG